MQDKRADSQRRRIGNPELVVVLRAIQQKEPLTGEAADRIELFVEAIQSLSRELHETRALLRQLSEDH